MIDPILPLSISIAEGKGVYALFLGSGISKSAGIPTGGDIFWNSVKLICKLEDNTVNISDDAEIDKWFEASQYKDFNYSKILEALCPSKEDRRNYLEKYFIDCNPTIAHKVIANLVKNELIKVIVTTNFDQLLENALDDENIKFDVVSDESDLKNLKPREHSNCRILKLNGDYKKLNIRNTETELEKYSDSISKELEEIFDRYGLIVVGYSGSDKAVIEHLENRISNYSIYWLARDKINTKIKELIKSKDGKIICRDSTDIFFKELERKINLFSTYPTGDTPEFLATTVKNLLREKDQIEINELSKAVVRDLIKKWEETFENFRMNSSKRLFHLKSMEDISDQLIVIGIILIEYNEYKLFNKLLKSFNTIINLSENLSGARSASIGDIPKMIVLELFYLWGSYSLHVENFTTLKLLFEFEISTRDDLVPLFSYNGIHRTNLFNENSSDSFDYILKYQDDRDYFNDFLDFKKDFCTILCQFDFIIALKVLGEPSERKYNSFPNFLRCNGSMIKPIAQKLERNKEFAENFSKYIFDEEPENLLPMLNDRFADIRKSSRLQCDSSDWVHVIKIFERIGTVHIL